MFVYQAAQVCVERTRPVVVAQVPDPLHGVQPARLVVGLVQEHKPVPVPDEGVVYPVEQVVGVLVQGEGPPKEAAALRGQARLPKMDSPDDKESGVAKVRLYAAGRLPEPQLGRVEPGLT